MKIKLKTVISVGPKPMEVTMVTFVGQPQADGRPIPKQMEVTALTSISYGQPTEITRK
jgi:hypothetical protein